MGEFVYCGLPVLLAKGRLAVERSLVAEAEELANAADADAPVATGTLSGGIVSEVDGTTATIHTTAETNPGEALYEEIGSEHNAATQYMESAARSAAGSFPARLAAESAREF